MKFIKGLLLSVFAVSILSCTPSKKSEQTEFTTIKINDEYSLDVPGYMTKAKSLNDDASLQYQNIFKETYVIVIDEGKQEFIDAYVTAGSYDSTLSALENYANTQVQLTSSNMEQVLNRKDVKIEKINDLNIATSEIDGTFPGVKDPIGYFFTYVEGPDKMYMIMAWTLKNRKETYRKDFEKMSRSFKLLKNGPVAIK